MKIQKGISVHLYGNKRNEEASVNLVEERK